MKHRNIRVAKHDSTLVTGQFKVFIPRFETNEYRVTIEWDEGPSPIDDYHSLGLYLEYRTDYHKMTIDENTGIFLYRCFRRNFN